MLPSLIDRIFISSEGLKKYNYFIIAFKKNRISIKKSSTRFYVRYFAFQRHYHYNYLEEHFNDR